MTPTREEVRAWLTYLAFTAEADAKARTHDVQWTLAKQHQAACARAALDALEDAERFRGAIEWALGRGDSDFGDALGDRAPGDGKKPRIGRYWWRTELAQRAGLDAARREGAT